MRRWLRRILPFGVRQHIAQFRRMVSYRLSGKQKEIAPSRRDAAQTSNFKIQCSVEQKIFNAEHAAGKMGNLRLAAERLSHLVIEPGKIISFWKAVGTPTARNGFKLGRAIVGDQVTADIGGGLCQIGGLLYELGLRGGLEIVERHPHSRDLYAEENRFTPLGLDATVVWGTKDVLLRNAYDFPIAFAFEVEKNRIVGSLLASGTISPLGIKTRSTVAENGTHIAEVFKISPDGREILVSRDIYTIDLPAELR
jgi:vancomycin resistance protein VanW